MVRLASFLVLLASAAQASAAMLAIGDSITAGKYPAYLAPLLDVTIVNVAQPGARTNRDRSIDMQVQWDANKHGDYSHVLILGGINDFYQSVTPAPGMTKAETTTAHLFSFVDEALQADMRPVLMTIMPSGNHPKWNQTIQEEVEETNSALRVRAEPGDVTFVDMYELMGEPGSPTELAAIYDKGDGIHPNIAGRIRMAELLGDAISAEFRRHSDLSGDAVVDDTDVNLLLSQYREAELGPSGDIDNDGIVGQRDLGILLSNLGGHLGQPLAVPEPRGGILAVIGAIGLLASWLSRNRRPLGRARRPTRGRTRRRFLRPARPCRRPAR